VSRAADAKFAAAHDGGMDEVDGGDGLEAAFSWLLKHNLCRGLCVWCFHRLLPAAKGEVSIGIG
jgi:hypothetical protein